MVQNGVGRHLHEPLRPLFGCGTVDRGLLRPRLRHLAQLPRLEKRAPRRRQDHRPAPPRGDRARRPRRRRAKGLGGGWHEVQAERAGALSEQVEDLLEWRGPDRHPRARRELDRLKRPVKLNTNCSGSSVQKPEGPCTCRCSPATSPAWRLDCEPRWTVCTTAPPPAAAATNLMPILPGSVSCTDNPTAAAAAAAALAAAGSGDQSSTLFSGDSTSGTDREAGSGLETNEGRGGGEAAVRVGDCAGLGLAQRGGDMRAAATGTGGCGGPVGGPSASQFAMASAADRMT